MNVHGKSHWVGFAIFFMVFGSGFSIPSSAQIVNVEQGRAWTSDRRVQFYTQDQGSRIMPLAWMRALKLPDGAGFLDDSLTRYGYLPNPARSEPDIPVGFTVAEFEKQDSIGMTCAACHTRQIDVKGTAYRIDGGPAIVDFQGFLKDLDDATAAVLASSTAFDAFAKAAIGGSGDKGALKVAVEDWYLRYHTLIERSLPDPAWGPGRLDAVSMIFNRLAGLDIGEPPTYIIADNIAVADAPTRYPFLWNAARQDRTQWPGFAENGNSILGLARNLGEVYGVFGYFHPIKQDGLFELNRDYISQNSANFKGLGIVEDRIWDIGAPKWPWQLDHDLVRQGEAIFNLATDQGGCKDCHQIKTGAFRSFEHRTWATPVIDVGTDARECAILTRTVDTGTLAGADIPFITKKLGKTDTAFNVLTTAVIGAIAQNALSLRASDPKTLVTSVAPELPPEFEHLTSAFSKTPSAAANSVAVDTTGSAKSGCAYESRVMEGIWAAAPYLHNGSVPTLEALLLPVSARPASFKLGPNYDIDAVGLAVTQTKFDHTLETTDCSDKDSGNSRCGHEFGTKLSDVDRRALLEYLKAL